VAIKAEQVTYRLNIMCRHDEKTGAHIGYIPRLQVYSQANTIEDLTQALRVTAREFIIACSNKGILQSVMKEGGMHPTPRSVVDLAEDQGEEFVSIGYKECEEPIEVTVPLSLIAEHESVTVS
jgi:hypothetical protein